MNHPYTRTFRVAPQRRLLAVRVTSALLAASCLGALFFGFSPQAQAANGTWIKTTGGPFNWDDTANWSGGVIADGADFTAFFTANITALQTNVLNNPKTIGNITFTDSGSSHDLVITGANTLTLDRTDSVAPTINVTQSGRTLTISSVIAGTDGLTKAGAGALTLNGANTFSGGITIQDNGILRPATDIGLGNTAQTITFGSGGGRLDFTLYGHANSSHRTGAVIVTAGNTGTMQFSYQTGSNIAMPITGSGTLILSSTGGSASSQTLTNPSSTFTGSLILNNPANVNITMNSLGNGDAGTVLQLGAGTLTSAATFTYAGSSALSGRQLVLGGGANTLLRFNNDGADIVTFTQDIGYAANNTGAKTLQLGGSNAGLNDFSGAITNGAFAVSLTKLGTGRWRLSATNNYTGVTTISGGILEATYLADGGVASSIGATANAAGNLLLGNKATLRYVGTGDSTDRAFTINGTADGHLAILDASGSGAINWTSTTSPSYGTVNQTRTLVLSGTNTDTNTLAANIANNGTGAVSLIKSNSGTWVLSGASTYTGATTIRGGVLAVTSMANGGTASSIGASTSAAGNLNLTNGATLRYIGTGHTSDRGFTINGTAAGHSATIEASGSGALTLSATTSPAYGTVNQTRTLVLSGTSTDANTLAANIANNGSGLVSLVKSNAGTWVLSGASTYTGATDVKGGILRVTGSLASPTVTVSAGATLAGTGTMAAKIQGAGSVDPGNSPGILTANQLDPSGGLSFNFEFSALTPTYTLPASSGNDVLRLTNSTTPFLANLTLANVVNVYIATGVIPTPGSQQTYQGGFFTDRNSDFINSITNATFNVYLQDASGSTVYNGVNYRFHGAPVEVRTVDSGHTFTGGANGWVMEFDVMNAIPEPSTVFLFVCGLLMLKRYGRRRS